MKSQEKNRCPLCERHQRMQTTSGSINGASITISTGGDISITSPTKVEVSAPVLNAEGASGDVKVQSISLVQHKHTSAAPGSESSPPLP